MAYSPSYHQEGDNQTQTEVVTDLSEVDGTQPPVLRLRLEKPKNSKKVVWNTNTIDNENMGKKKSKCCCIYKKPSVFGESSSESEDECEHCFGHPEKKKKNKKGHGYNCDEEGNNLLNNEQNADGTEKCH